MATRIVLGMLALALVVPLATAGALTDLTSPAKGLDDDVVAQAMLVSAPARRALDAWTLGAPIAGPNALPAPEQIANQATHLDATAVATADTTLEDNANTANDGPHPSRTASSRGPRVSHGLVPMPLVGAASGLLFDLSTATLPFDRPVILALPPPPASDDGAGAGDDDLTPASTAPTAAADPLATPSGATLLFAGLAATAAGGALTAQAASATAPWWARLRRLAMGAALYTRLNRQKVLDHDGRDALVSHVRDHPGSTVADLARATDTARNTASYHLRVLEREGVLVARKQGRARLYFLPGESREAAAANALRHETTRAFAAAVGCNPGETQASLCERLGLRPSLAHWHATRLVEVGVVEKRRDGRVVRYFPGDAYDTLARLD